MPVPYDITNHKEPVPYDKVSVPYDDKVPVPYHRILVSDYIS